MLDKKIVDILEKTKNQKIGLFIDNANWFYPQQELGWKISFSKLKEFLENNYKIKVLKLYAGTPLDGEDQKRFAKFVKALEKTGFTVMTKPLKKIWLNNNKTKFQHKCNFDVEIALDIARHLNEIDLIMIGSGDSDFLEISRFAKEHKKSFIALCFEKGVAWEMRKHYHIFIEHLKESIKQS